MTIRYHWYFAVSAQVVFGRDWNVVANPTAKDKEFIEAVEFILGSITRVMMEFPWYRIYPDKFSREFKRAQEVKRCTSCSDGFSLASYYLGIIAAVFIATVIDVDTIITVAVNFYLFVIVVVDLFLHIHKSRYLTL